MHNGFLEELESGCPMISNIMPHETEKPMSKPLEPEQKKLASGGNKGFEVVGGNSAPRVYGGKFERVTKSLIEEKSIGGIDAIADDYNDNLAIVLCSYFEGHLSRPDDDESTERTWGEWTERMCNDLIFRATSFIANSLSVAHNADMQALRDQLKQSTELIETQRTRIKELSIRIAQRDGLVQSGRAI